ncbi:MAG: DUF3817 domain-containing protein [Myxococcota bacterium]
MHQTRRPKWVVFDELLQLRIVSILEGTSYLLLLGVAVPLKHLWDEPSLVRIMGRVHGFLFVLFLVVLARAAASRSWGVRRVGGALLSAIVPGGAFLFERRLRRDGAIEGERSRRACDDQN